MNDTAHHYNDELMQRLSSGDPDAFTLLYKQHYQRIYRFAKLYLADRQDAEDITAETFIKLWNHRNSFRNINALKSFLHITTRNSCFDLVRHQKVMSEKQAEIISQLDVQIQPDLQQTKDELLKLVKNEVDKLSSKMRRIYSLSYNEGLTPAQIAAALNLSVQTISNQKTALLKMLKRALAQATSFLTLFAVVFV